MDVEEDDATYLADALSVDKSEMFLYYWKMLCPEEAEPIPEYNFDGAIKRRHRFDWAFLNELVAVEVDGGSFAYRGGRHSTDTDRDKMNIAASLGWLVFRFSPTMLSKEPQRCIEQVITCLVKRRDGLL